MHGTISTFGMLEAFYIARLWNKSNSISVSWRAKTFVEIQALMFLEQAFYRILREVIYFFKTLTESVLLNIEKVGSYF